MKGILLSLVILLVLPGMVSATEYYVDCSHTSNGDGLHPDTAWNRIWRVNNYDGFQNGDDLYFKVGTTCTPGNPFYVRWNGASDDRVIIGAYYGEGQFGLNGNPRPIIDGNDNTVPGEWQSLVTVRRSSPTDVYVTVQDLYLRNSGFVGVEFSQANEIAVDNCYFYYPKSSGILVANSINGAITNNIVDHSGVSGDGCAGGITVSGMSKPNTYNIRVAHNTVFGSKCEGIDLIKQAHDCVAEYNVVYDSTNIGIYLSNSYNNTARYNIVFETGGNGYCCDYMHGIVIQNEDETGGKILFGGWNHSIYGNLVAHCWYGIVMASHGGNVTNASVYGNTVVDCYNNVRFNNVNADWADNEIKNNIFLSINEYSTHSNSYNPASVTWSNNLFWGDGSVTGTNAANNAEFGDPLLTKTSGWSPIDPVTVDPNWWKLQAGSYAIDKGTDIDSTYEPYDIDYFGTIRPQGEGWDIGAHEYTGGSCTESWTCTDWSCSACVAGQQDCTRTCTDDHECGTVSNKPPETETQACGTAGLVGYWSMNSSDISDGTVLDMSGFGNSGTIHGAVSTTGRVAEALSFDGVNDYVAVTDDSSMSSASKTLAVWVKLDSLGTNDLIAGKASEEWLAYNAEFGSCAADRFCFIVQDGAGWVGASSTLQPAAGQWYHVVGVYDGAHISIYVNGVLEGDPVLQGVPSDGSYPFDIGTFSGDIATYATDAAIDEVMLWNRALSAQEIQDLYDSYSGELVGHWTFDTGDISGSTVLDMSGFGNSGTIHGTTPVTGRVGEALYFDGSFVEIDNQDMFDTNEKFTITAWILPVGWGGGGFGTILGKEDIGVYDFMFYLRGSDSNLAAWDRSTSGFADSVDSSISLNEWQHVVLTYNGSNGATFYINGVERTDDDWIHLTNPAGSFFIGAENDTVDYGFNGRIDDVRVWNRSLSAGEILNLYDSSFHRADNNPRDGCIRIDELGPFIDLWKYDSTANPMWEVMEAVTLWSRGTGCIS